jgi:hypothetical protein
MDERTIRSDLAKMRDIQGRKKPGEVWTSEDDRELLKHIFDDVERQRKAAGLPPLSNDPQKGH